MMSIYTFAEGEGLRKGVSPGDLPGLLERDDVFIWVDMLDPGDEETDVLADVFRFHQLAIEDTILERQYPKIDEYPGYLFLVVHGSKVEAARVIGGSEPITTKELNIFLGPRYLVTIHEEQMRSIGQTRALLEKNPDTLQRGPAYLLHSVLDYLVDHYIPVIETLDNRIDELEERMREDSTNALNEVFEVRQHVARIRRLASRQREILGRLSRREFALVGSSVSMYFRDVYDHLVRISDQAESYRELLSSLMEVALANNANRLNVIMKTLTLVNTIFLPLTFVTGLYGMNFDNLPGKSVHVGFWICLGFMTAVATFMLFMFRRKKWL